MRGLLRILAASGFYSSSIFRGRCAVQIGCDELGQPDMECICECQVEADIDIDPQVETVGEHEHAESTREGDQPRLLLLSPNRG